MLLDPRLDRFQIYYSIVTNNLLKSIKKYKKQHEKLRLWLLVDVHLTELVGDNMEKRLCYSKLIEGDIRPVC